MRDVLLLIFYLVCQTVNKFTSYNGFQNIQGKLLTRVERTTDDRISKLFIYLFIYFLLFIAQFRGSQVFH